MVQTSLGNFYLELDHRAAPKTVRHFLDYVRAGVYNNSYIHAAIGGSIIRGGKYRYNNCNVGPEIIATKPPIALENTGLSSVSGAIAMRRISEEDNERVGSAWFITLGKVSDNHALNGNSAVFGRVIGTGLDTVRTIANAPGVRLTSIHTAPTSNYFGGEQVNCQHFSRDHLVQVRMVIVSEDEDYPSADYNSLNERLAVNLDLGDSGFKTLQFSVDNGDDGTTIRALQDTTIVLSAPVPNMASYNALAGDLRLPVVAVDGNTLFQNLHFTLVDGEKLVFRLISSEPFVP
ncbi:MAG: peptidylprolyl isomerase [Gammaproteobacteria bacterium]|nr:peptidylprolyl isomerase [Gammaproteobacteria bacterium]